MSTLSICVYNTCKYLTPESIFAISLQYTHGARIEKRIFIVCLEEQHCNATSLVYDSAVKLIFLQLP